MVTISSRRKNTAAGQTGFNHFRQCGDGGEDCAEVFAFRVQLICQ